MTKQIEQVRVAAIYNPHTQTKAQLIDGFAVRQKTFQRLFKAIRDSKMQTPEQNYLLLGRRGMGKTTMLLRLAYEIENTPELSDWLLPAVFNEEEYGIRRLFNFWERTMDLLEQQCPELQFDLAERKRLSNVHKDDDAYERVLFEWLSAELERTGKKAILFVDNFGTLTDKFTENEAHRLRKILQDSTAIRIFAASAVVLEDFYRYDHPFYEFFKVEELRGLNEKETRELLLSLSEHYKKETVAHIVEHFPGRIEALRRITGGVIRTIVLLFEIFVDDEDGNAFKDLEIVLDRTTPLYKHRMDDLSKQQQAIVEAIALNWDGVTVKDMVESTRLDSKTISSQLQILEKNGVVEKRANVTKNHIYLVAERFFNIWFLMRLGRRGDEKRVQWLVRFFEDWCDGDMMSARAEAHRLAVRRGNFDPEAALFYTQAMVRTKGLSSVGKHELLRDTRSYLSSVSPDLAQDLPASDLDMAYEGCMLWFEGKKEEAVKILGNLAVHFLGEEELVQFDEKTKEGKLVEFWEANMSIFSTKVASNFTQLKQPDWDKAEKIWLYAAEQGFTIAMVALGLFYHEVYKDFDKAKDFYEKSINEDVFDALNNLGVLYHEVYKDFDKAKVLYEKAAEKGYIDAMNNLGVLYQNEIKNFKMAQIWYEKAAGKGYVEAMNNLGLLYSNELKDVEKAKEWYEMAAKKGNSDAMFNLGWLYRNELKDVEKAKEWYEMAAKKGNSDAMFNLGLLYSNQLKDIVKAKEWYEMAAKKGDSNAMNNLGLLYSNELKDNDKAKEWYEMAANKGQSDAMNNLAWLYQDELKDIEKAKEWYEMAAKKGDSNAMNNLGWLYQDELKDIEKAKEWYELSLNKGNSGALNSLAWLYFKEKKEKDKALELITECLKSKDEMFYHHTAACIYAWHDKMPESKTSANEFLKNEQLLEVASEEVAAYLIAMLGKGEAKWLLECFTSPEGEAVQLKDRFKPVYYAVLKQLDHPDFLRMGDELIQTVEEILEKSKKVW